MTLYLGNKAGDHWWRKVVCQSPLHLLFFSSGRNLFLSQAFSTWMMVTTISLIQKIVLVNNRYLIYRSEYHNYIWKVSINSWGINILLTAIATIMKEIILDNQLYLQEPFLALIIPILQAIPKDLPAQHSNTLLPSGVKLLSGLTTLTHYMVLLILGMHGSADKASTNLLSSRVNLLVPAEADKNRNASRPSFPGLCTLYDIT